jgi:myo-inositol-1(or 4)-monophosphatase
MSSPTVELQERHDAALSIVNTAAERALELFREGDLLDIEVKGLQDWVSNADKSVEDLIRAALGEAFPDDSIVGEEHANKKGSSAFTWVIDPIDGTTNFVNSTPGWCVVLACVQKDQTVLAAICDPIPNETYTAIKGQGARLNGEPIHCSPLDALDKGTLGVGHSTRVPPGQTSRLLDALLRANGLFRRSGSGALDLAYVAAGRLLGYVEPHMNAWDCLASMLLIEEAGGKVEPFDMPTMLASGCRVIVAGPNIYSKVRQMTVSAYEQD